MNKLIGRLLLAVFISTSAVTLTLAPLIGLSLADRTENARKTAQALLDSEYKLFSQEINESVKQALMIAEFPAVVRYLETAQSSAKETRAEGREARLETVFENLLVHFSRYRRLVLIDNEGMQRFPVVGTEHSSDQQGHIPQQYVKKVNTAEPDSFFVSSPYIDYPATDSRNAATLVDLSVPVFGNAGLRLGVLVLTLDWHHLTNRLPLALGADAQAQVLLLDEQGRSLISLANQNMPGGSPLPQRWPEAWNIINASAGGEALLENHLLAFKTHTIRAHELPGRADGVSGSSDIHPWHIGVLIPKPSLYQLMRENPWGAALIALVYCLSIGFGIGWVWSNHRQRTLRVRAQRLSEEAKKHARDFTDLYEKAPCGYHSLDDQGVIMRINATELAWLGYAAEELIGVRRYRDLVTPGTRDAFDQCFEQVRVGNHEGSVECELVRKDGSALPVSIEASAHTDSRGFVYSRAIVFDLTERKKLEAMLVNQAMTDPLTELGNRRYMERQAAMEIARAQRDGKPTCLIAIDLDHFKTINDRHGHDVGDLVLQAFAQSTRKELREGDVFCRMGGEEFSILLPKTSLTQARNIAERLRDVAQNTPVKIGNASSLDAPLHYTVSIGVTQVIANEDGLSTALKRADTLLYEAKNAGRNRVVAPVV